MALHLKIKIVKQIKTLIFLILKYRTILGNFHGWDLISESGYKRCPEK